MANNDKNKSILNHATLNSLQTYRQSFRVHLLDIYHY
jgi:hypothetical protein